MSGYRSTPFRVTRKTCRACEAKKHTQCDQRMADLEVFPSLVCGSCDCSCWDGKETSMAALAETAENWPFVAAISMRLAGNIHICFHRKASR